GAWFNKVGRFSINSNPAQFPRGVTDTFDRSFSSVYGNVFYKYIGVQGGVIRVTEKVETVITDVGTITDDDGGQKDIDVFAVGRVPSIPGFRQVGLLIGAGAYRYGTRSQDAGPRLGPPSPSAMVFSGFSDITFRIYKGLVADLSLWYTAADKDRGINGLGNAQQTRVTYGLGYHF